MRNVLWRIRKICRYFSALRATAYKRRFIVGTVRSILYRITHGPLPRPEEFFGFGRAVSISPDCQVSGAGHIAIGDQVIIRRLVWLWIHPDTSDSPHAPKLVIGDGSDIGQMCVIVALNRIELGEKVLLGPRVHIADGAHAFEDITRPIMDQGPGKIGQVVIEDGVWIGANAVIVASRGHTLVVGRNSVVGANTLLNQSVPDYCVVVGNPARIVRRYDSVSSKWCRADESLKDQTEVGREENSKERGNI